MTLAKHDHMPTVLYRCYNAAGELLYVGVSMSVKTRLAAHGRERQWWPEVARITKEHFSTRAEALDAEFDAITSGQPRYNCVHTPIHGAVSHNKAERPGGKNRRG